MMYISTIASLTREVRNMKGSFTFIEDEVIDLIIAIGEYLAINNQEEALSPGYLTLQEFSDKYLFVAANTLSYYCKNNKEFAPFVQRVKGKYHIHAEKAAQFLAKLPYFKARIDRLIICEKNAAR